MTDEEMWRWLVDHTSATFEAYYKITDKNGRLVPFKVNRIQKRVLGHYEWTRVRNIPWLANVLKPRQTGLSTVIGGICMNRVRHSPGTHGFVMSHDTPSVNNVYDIYTTFEDNFPDEPAFNIPISSRRQSSQQHTGRMVWKRPKYDANDNRSWVDSGGSWIAGVSAGKSGGGASARANVKHTTEAGFNTAPWHDVVATTDQCNNLAPDSIDVIESTAEENFGFWFEEYWDGVAKKSARVSLFYPFFIHDEYVHELNDDEDRQLEMGDGEVIQPYGIGIEEQADDSREVSEIRDAFNQYFRLDELSAPKYAERRHHIISRREQTLKWRLWLMDNKLRGSVSRRIQNFRKFYPWTDEVCWLSTDQSLFDQRKISARILDCHKRSAARAALPEPEVYPRWGNRENTVWLIHPPKTTGEYEIYWDVSHGKVDPSAMMVIDWTRHNSGYRVPVCVAVWHGKQDVGRQVIDCMMLAQHYKTGGDTEPRIIIERNGPGHQALDYLQNTYHYTRIYAQSPKPGQRAEYGFYTSPGGGPTSKARATSLLERFIYDFEVDYEEFWQEAKTFGPQADGGVRGNRRCHDDFMACAWMMAVVGVESGYLLLPESDPDALSIPVLDAPKEEVQAPDIDETYLYSQNGEKGNWQTSWMNVVN